MRRLEELCGLLFKTPPGVAIDRLVRFLTNNLGQRLTTAALITAVGHLEIEWRAFMDETLDGKFGTATQEYLDTLATTISEISVDTADLNEVLRTIFQGEQQITVVAGGAGSGKSVALSRAITEAQRKGWPILAFRIDRYLNIETLSELGDALLEVDESPVSAFGNRNSTRPCLLVIDQIDAVSEASGRSGRIRELFFRMIDQTAHFASMRVVAACRSYDLDGDTRLEALSKALRATSVRLKPFDWTANVEPILDRLSVDPRRFSAREQELLCVPINLRLFASLVASGESMAGEISSTRLFDKLLEVRGRELHQAGYGWTPEVALGAVAQSMSDNQDLTAPAAVLAPFRVPLMHFPRGVYSRPSAASFSSRMSHSSIKRSRAISPRAASPFTRCSSVMSNASSVERKFARYFRACVRVGSGATCSSCAKSWEPAMSATSLRMRLPVGCRT
jgi:hypothetical protein